jgi:hypothetical protein
LKLYYTSVFQKNTLHFQEIYRKVLPLYFPRNESEEQFCIDELPENIGTLVLLYKDWGFHVSKNACVFRK